MNLYIWRHNKNSITRALGTKEYFSENYINYIYGQCEALKKIFELIRNNTNILCITINYYLSINFIYYSEFIKTCKNLIAKNSVLSIV